MELSKKDCSKFTIRIYYPWLPPTCANCKQIGHILRFCPGIKQVWVPKVAALPEQASAATSSATPLPSGNSLAPTLGISSSHPLFSPIKTHHQSIVVPLSLSLSSPTTGITTHPSNLIYASQTQSLITNSITSSNPFSILASLPPSSEINSLTLPPYVPITQHQISNPIFPIAPLQDQNISVPLPSIGSLLSKGESTI